MIAKRYDDAAECADEALASVRDYLHRGTEEVTQLIGDRPATSLFVACLAGFGVGFVLTQVLDQQARDQYRSSAFDRSTTERFGRNLLDRVEQVLPSMLRERFLK